MKVYEFLSAVTDFMMHAFLSRRRGVLSWATLLWVTLGAMVLPPAWGEERVDFKKAFDSALQNTEFAKISQNEAAQAAERVKQANGAILPSLALNASYTRQQDVNATGGLSSSFQRPDQHSIRVTATQPLFRGLREFAALRAAGNAEESAKALTDNARLLLFSAVGEAYYNVASAEQDLKNLHTLFDLSRKQVKELEGRVKIGRSRKADLFTAESQAAAVQAQIQAADAIVQQTRDNFAYSTGLNRLTPIDSQTGLPSRLVPIDQYLARIEIRPDIRSRQELLRIAEENVSIARGQHLPSLDFSGNYYLNRTGILEPVKWDIGFNLSFPIFSGGVTSSQVREASLRSQEEELVLSRARRLASRDIHSAYELVENGIQQIKYLEVAVETTERTFRAQNADFRLGLVPNLDVIQSLNASADAKRTLDRTQFQAQIAWINLQAAVGDLK